MKRFLSCLLALSSLVTAAHAQTVIDPFTSPDSVTYNYQNAYYGGGTFGSIADFGTVSGGIWTPAPPAGAINTDHFIVNNSAIQLANIGDSVSLDFNMTALDGSAVGIILSSDLAGSNTAEILVQASGGTGYFFTGGGPGSAQTTVQTGYSTLTVTKESADTFLASVSGGGLATPFSETVTFSAANDYIGLSLFANGGTTATAENFILNAASVPEPSQTVLMSLGLLTVIVLVRSRKNHIA